MAILEIGGGSAGQGGTLGKGTVGAPRRVRVGVGAGGRVAGALSEDVRRSRLRGRSLVQVGENCHASILEYQFMVIYSHEFKI